VLPSSATQCFGRDKEARRGGYVMQRAADLLHARLDVSLGADAVDDRSFTPRMHTQRDAKCSEITLRG